MVIVVVFLSWFGDIFVTIVVGVSGPLILEVLFMVSS